MVAAGPALALDRVPVAVVWMGDAASLEAGGAQRTVEEVNAQLGRSPTARPIDGNEDRRTLVEGGPATRVQLLLRRAETSFVKLKYADATRDYEAAEQLLLNEVPFDFLRATLGDVERNLLACYDQLGRAADAARAAERLTWTAGSNEDMKRLVDRYWVPRSWEPALPPVTVESEPAGAIVYRDLRELGAAPQTMAGGDPSVDVLDVEARGYRRVHRELRAGESIRVALVKDDRLGVLVDAIRAQSPDANPKDVAAVGRRVGAARVLVLLPDGPKKLLGRWLDVGKAAWAPESARVDAGGGAAMEQLAKYVAPKEPAGPPPGAALTATAPEKKKSRLGAWGKWYTWVAAGAVVALVVGVLVASKVVSDSLTVTATH
ncbi:MAG TPA: PEGA domain-containing protein [Polyangia bacterium]